MCREEARDLAELAPKAALVGIVKELAPTKQAVDDEKLGVAAFETEYFKGGKLYLDEDKAFYQHLGNRKLISAGGFFRALWRPLTTYRGLKDVSKRLEAKGIEGNMVGEGLLLGGVLVVAPDGSIVFEHKEVTGTPVDVALVKAALDKLPS